MFYSKESLDAVFHPQSIAVVGAAREPYKWGHLILNGILSGGYAGKVYAINPHAGEVLGLPTLPSLRAIGQAVDLAVVVVPAPLVPAVIAEAGQVGVKAAIVISSGFGEADGQGRALAQEVLAIARQGNVRLVGPNGMGIYSTASRLCAMMVPVPISPGRIAFITQSGGYGMQLFFLAYQMGLGVHSFVSSGNELDLTATDYLEYFGQEPDIRCIILYLEGIHPGEGARFIEVARRTTRRKPVILVKVGASAAGRRAAASHTGSMVGVDDVYEAAFKQAGVIRASDPAQLFDFARALTYLPLPKSNRVGVLTRSGGAGVEAADRCEQQGLVVVPFTEETTQKIKGVLLPFASPQNPVDVSADMTPEPYTQSLRFIAEDPNVDGIVALGLSDLVIPELESRFPWFSVLLDNTLRSETLALVKQMKGNGKPIVVESVSGPGEENLRLLREAGIPVYPTPERAVDALATLWRYKQHRDSADDLPLGRTSALTAEQMQALQAVEASRQAGREVLGPAEAEALLLAYGIPIAASRLARTVEEAVAAAAETLGYPVALKIVSPQVLHKTEAGGVRLALGDALAVRHAFAEVVAAARAYAPDATIEGVLVQRQAPPGGHEVIVGMKRDEQFGPVVLVGLGGVFTEVLRDTALRVAPLTMADAQAMLPELRGYPLLAGARGQPPADLDALADVLGRVADLALACPTLVELDLNPVFVYPQGQGCLAVDARLMLA